VKLAPGSDRAAGARRFGLELRRALAARKQTHRGFADRAGIGRSRLENWMAGTSLPSTELAERLADELLWPRLADLARQARTHACDACGTAFVVETPSPQRYCSTDCRRFQNAKRVPGRRDLTRSVLERRVTRYRAAVVAMCAACEPSGVCRTASCPLQVAGVSPHPLARGAVA
jgi:hypothetical protein